MKLVNYQTAKALQELGYDGYYNYIYAKNTESSLRYIGFKEVFELSEYTGPPAPRLDDVAYWIRDKYQLSIEAGVTMAKCWAAYIYDYADDVIGQFCEIYDSYDEALEEGIKKAIEIVNSRNKSDRESDENKRNR